MSRTLFFAHFFRLLMEAPLHTPSRRTIRTNTRSSFVGVRRGAQAWSRRLSTLMRTKFNAPKAITIPRLIMLFYSSKTQPCSSCGRLERLRMPFFHSQKVAKDRCFGAFSWMFRQAPTCKQRQKYERMLLLSALPWFTYTAHISNHTCLLGFSDG